VIDSNLNAFTANLSVLFTNLPSAATCPVSTTGPAQIQESDGGVSAGPARVVSVNLAPMQVLILG